MRTSILSLAVLACGYSNAAVMITANDGVDTPGLAGFKTYTITASSDGPAIAGFDFAGNPDLPDDGGFYGPMNQINPAGQGTVFQDANGFFAFVGADVLQDSQFLFATTALPAEVASARFESSSRLSGLFSVANPAQSIAFAQLVLPNSASGLVNYLGVIGLADGTEVRVEGMLPGTTPVIPEPSTLALAGLALAGVIGLRRRG